jgi:DNA-binding transcriptional MerR regulator
MQTTENQTYNIQFVANITGINPHTIRAWEKRYQAILPQRDHNGRRLYSNSDIDRLSTLHKLVKM